MRLYLKKCKPMTDRRKFHLSVHRGEFKEKAENSFACS